MFEVSLPRTPTDDARRGRARPRPRSPRPPALERLPAVAPSPAPPSAFPPDHDRLRIRPRRSPVAFARLTAALGGVAVGLVVGAVAAAVGGPRPRAPRRVSAWTPPSPARAACSRTRPTWSCSTPPTGRPCASTRAGREALRAGSRHRRPRVSLVDAVSVADRADAPPPPLDARRRGAGAVRRPRERAERRPGRCSTSRPGSSRSTAPAARSRSAATWARGGLKRRARRGPRSGRGGRPRPQPVPGVDEPRDPDAADLRHRLHRDPAGRGRREPARAGRRDRGGRRAAAGDARLGARPGHARRPPRDAPSRRRSTWSEPSRQAVEPAPAPRRGAKGLAVSVEPVRRVARRRRSTPTRSAASWPTWSATRSATPRRAA